MNLRAKLIILLAVVVGVSVTGYNIWSLSCGRCTVHTLFTLGPPGYSLLALNIIMMTVLLVLKWRRASEQRRLHCRCGARVIPTWHYCPVCGAARVEHQ